VAAGQPTVVSGQGFAGGSQLTITMFSSPVVLGTTTADASGSYQATVTIPAATIPGSHTLTVAPASGAPQVATLITVTAAGTTTATTATTIGGVLSFTGSDTQGKGLVAAILLILGFLLVFLNRRRHPDLWPTLR
jgi:LPXTG-motif cell wall-anchored protein